MAEKKLLLPENSVIDDVISLKEILQKVSSWWKYFLSKWMIFLVAGFIGGGLGLAYSYIKKPIFVAATTFVLEEENSSGGGGGMLGQLGGLAGIAGISVGGGGGLFQGDNIIQLYTSRRMVQEALLSKIERQGKEQLLIDYYIEINKLRKSWSKNRELISLNFKEIPRGKEIRLRDSILGVAVQDINLNYLTVNKPDKKLSVIKVEVKAKDELFAKYFNEQIVKTVNDFYVRTKTKKSLENLEILQRQTDSVRSVLDGAIYRTAAVADATPNLNPTRQILRTPGTRSQFNAEANKAILTQLVQNLEMAKIALRKETPLIQVIDSPVFPLEKRIAGKLISIFNGSIFLMIIVFFLLIGKKLYLDILERN